MLSYASETMTCVDWEDGSNLKVNGRPVKYAAYRNHLTGQYIFLVDFVSGTQSIASYIQLYTIASDSYYTLGPLEGFSYPGCIMPSNLVGAQIRMYPIGETTSIVQNGYPLVYGSILPNKYTTLPTLELETKFLAGYDNPITWTLIPGDGRTGSVTALTVYKKAVGSSSWQKYVQFTESSQNQWHYVTGDDVGCQYYMEAEYRTFKTNTNLDAFFTLNRMTTEIWTVERDVKNPPSPVWITTGLLIDGGKVTVDWSPVVAEVYPVASYILQRAVGTSSSAPGSFTTVYNGAATQFQDKLPSNITSVAYRVQAVNSLGNKSAWYTTESMPTIRSNTYIGVGGRWVRAAKIYMGNKTASARVYINGKT